MFILNDDSYATIVPVKGYNTRMGIHFTNMQDCDSLAKLFLYAGDDKTNIAIAKSRAFVITHDWFREFILTFDMECPKVKESVEHILLSIGDETKSVSPDFRSELNALIGEIYTLPN